MNTSSSFEFSKTIGHHLKIQKIFMVEIDRHLKYFNMLHLNIYSIF